MSIKNSSRPEGEVLPHHSPNGVPFCWQPKEALERIEQGLELEQAGSAKLVYLALSRIGCNEDTPIFTKPINYVAILASVNRRTVERRLPDLERLGLVTVERGKLRTAHRYSLTTLSRNDTTPSRNVATRSGSHRVALNREVENKRRKPTTNANSTPLTTAERIGLEKNRSLLTERIKQLEDGLYYPWQKKECPEKVQELKAARQQLSAIEARLLST